MCPLNDSESFRQELGSSHEWQTALAEWLAGQEWDYFLTVTFRTPFARHQATTALRGLRKTLARCYTERAFLAAEHHVSTDIHLHGLWKGEERTISARDMWFPLFRRFGRSTVSPVRSQEAVARYTAKYVTKELTDYLMM